MNADKRARVGGVRANTAYPTYRGIVGMITVILMILAALQAIGSFIGMIAMFGMAAQEHQASLGFAWFLVLLIGLAFAVLTFFLAKFWNEASLILADIGDVVLDSSSDAAGFAPSSQPALGAPQADLSTAP